MVALTDVTPMLAPSFTLLAFTIVIIGGLGSMAGALLGGLLIGVAQTMVAGYVPFIGTELSLPGALLVMVLILMVKPTGLFGTPRIERV
jgi:branched-chain amino acid transport system permease protein